LNRVDSLGRLLDALSNKVELSSVNGKKIAGIVGDAPSHYAKSPSLWNAAFAAFGMDAVYLPFDVGADRLADFAQALKDCESLMGVNVTVPYKVRMLDYLDTVDAEAARIKAVNTVVRTRDGKLVGYNTDGAGFVESVLTTTPGREKPFMDSLTGVNALIIGAGGSARAVGFHAAKLLGTGRLFLCNRNLLAAQALADEINSEFRNSRAIPENEIGDYVPLAGLIVNCSTKGQGGIRQTADGKCTILEPYSSLAPANPIALAAPSTDTLAFYREWLRGSVADVEANQRASFKLALAAPPTTRFCDLIYHPEETVLLQHARLSGHQTLNGKGMVIAQAALSFHEICAPYLLERGISIGEKRTFLLESMYQAW
jgi:shikimate dehydrogenase